MLIKKREKCLEKIRPYYNKQLIKALTGQRRVGKSYMLHQIRDELHKSNPGAKIIFIDKEKYEFDDIRTYKDLMHYVKAHTSKGMNYLFIDEVQEIQEFEKALRSLLSTGKYDIYCTGSNSALLSGELSTYLSGRQIEIRIQSLSYPEFLLFHKLKKGAESLSLYIKYGGLPYLIHLPKKDEIIFDYLKNIYATILFRDIVGRYGVRDIAFLERLIKYIADNTGSIFSANRIAAYLKSQQSTKTVSVIINYLKYLEQAYFISSVKRKDIQGKKIFETGEKYYFEDIGLRNIIGGYKASDIGKILENLVYNHLCFRGYEVFIGKDNDKEIDFVAEKNNEISYFQVAYMLSSEQVVEREFGNLLKIRDHYPEYVISMDDFPVTTSYKGIKHLKLIDFLTDKM